MRRLVTAPATALPSQPSPYAVLRNRSFRRIWTAQLVSTIGDALTSLAAGIIVLERTHSVLSVGLMLMATAVPTLVVGLIAGIVVDRFDRKKIMVASDLIRAGLVATLPFLLISTGSVAWLYVVVILSSSVTQFFSPANESVLPEIASEEELGAANAIMAIAQFGSTAVGFAAAGFLATTKSVELVFYIDSATFLFSALMISLVRVAPLEVTEHITLGEQIRNIGFGAKFIWNTPILRSLNIVRVPVLIAFGMQNVLLLPFALRVLRADDFQYGLQEGLTSVGFVIGSLAMARLADRLREGQWLVLSFVAMGVMSLAYAFQTSAWVAISLIAVSGAMNAPSFVAGRLINQRNTPRESRGRVFSTSYVLRDVVYLSGMALAGLADIVDVRLLFVISSVVVIGAGLTAAVLPGLGQPAAEWRRAMSLLRGAASAPGLAIGRAPTAADLETLGGYLPALSGLTPRDRDMIVSRGRIREAATGTAVMRAGDKGEAAFFVLSGKLVAGVAAEGGARRTLSSMGPGEIVGEIATLTGSPRTADVVAEEPSTLLEIPGDVLRQLMAAPQFGQLVLSKMSERLARSASIADLPRFGGQDRATLRRLNREAEAATGISAEASGEAS
jgi:DHA3 family macrolide efflux protein-like MFS transporter